MFACILGLVALLHALFVGRSKLFQLFGQDCPLLLAVDLTVLSYCMKPPLLEQIGVPSSVSRTSHPS
jgi:hypothetical protein